MNSRTIVTIFGVLLILGLHAQDTLIKIACIGNSITAGYGLSNVATEGYPAQMQNILGKNYIVENFGISARTMLKTGDLPYWNEPQYKAALASNPNIVIIKLGTNDSKRWIWNAHGKEYKTDYKEMIQSFRNLPSNPEIYICLAIPGENQGWDIYNSYIKDSLNPQIKQIALDANVNLIDLNTPFLENEKQWLMGDGVHPTIAGCKVIAETVANALMQIKPTINLSENLLVAPNAAEYQWYCDRVIIPTENGGTSQTYKPTKPGIYMVSIKPQKDNNNRLISHKFLYRISK